MKYLLKGRQGQKVGVFETEWKTVYDDLPVWDDESARKQAKLGSGHGLIDVELFKRIDIDENSSRPYSETAGELAAEVEQKILRDILFENGVQVERLKKCEVRIRSHGRRQIMFDEDDFCSIPQKLIDGFLNEEFSRRRGELPSTLEDEKLRRG